MRSRLFLIISAGWFVACSSMNTQNVVQQEPVSRTDSTVVVRAGKLYKAGSFKRTILGDHYRDVWAAPVEVPLLKIKRVKGGLDITEKGGGMQTKSLKLEAENGRLYSIRSIQKDPSPALPKILRKTIADDIFQDQISAAHPYGAFVLPTLGEAAGIYHTNPKLYYLPDTKALGEYRDLLGGALVMLEEDADEDWSGYEDFGYTENAVSSETVLEDLREDNDNQVDQRSVLRNRLFDMWVGDWDRHEGQWRWAELENKDGKGNVYRPIPEDRDNVFFKFDGVLPTIANRKWAVRKFQSFEEEVRDIKGLNYNARHFDRRFLTELTKEDWLAIADTLQRRLTDDVIERAFLVWPDTIHELSADEVIRKLKARRSRLDEMALRYYRVLSETVNVYGSDKHEFFEVERLDDNHTRVTMYKSNDDGEKEKVLYKRTFDHDLTEEVRLYGFENNDFFEVKGKTEDGIIIRLIGGEDKDYVVDESFVRGWSKLTKVYDTKGDTKLTLGPESKDLTRKSLDVNRYDFQNFEYDVLAPQIFFGYNVDDGVFLGGGILIKKYGFRNDEFIAKHRLIANYAIASGAANVIYEGSFRNVFKDIDLDVDLEARAPNFISNFYGFGNETERLIEVEEFYQYRSNRIKLDMGFKVRFGEDNYLKFGPAYQYNDVREETLGFVSLPAADISPEAFNRNHFVGIFFETELSDIENQYYPKNGVRWRMTNYWFQGFLGEDNRYSRLESNLSFYYTPFERLNSPITFAFRIGGASNIGDYFFYQASTLSGSAGFSRVGNVRGYVRDRYSGRSVLYQNTEVRISLANFELYILPVRFGILGLMDHGRVFIDEENSDTWHRSYGGGIFLQPLDRWVFTGTYAVSDDDEVINFNLGFLF